MSLEELGMTLDQRRQAIMIILGENNLKSLKAVIDRLEKNEPLYDDSSLIEGIMEIAKSQAPHVFDNANTAIDWLRNYAMFMEEKVKGAWKTVGQLTDDQRDRIKKMLISSFNLIDIS